MALSGPSLILNLVLGGWLGFPLCIDGV